ncbi:hypothetical protein Dimus_019295 [Dionaea muscipula]
MASMRRTLPGARANGEACPMEKVSPLSKSSSSAHSDIQYGLQPYSSFSFLKQALYKMHIERSKTKGQVWRRTLMLFTICFLAGVFVGLTPFASMNLSGSLLSKHRTFFFHTIPSVAKYQSTQFEMKHITPADGIELWDIGPVLERFDAQENASREQGSRDKPERIGMDLGENAVSELPVEDPVFNLGKLLIIVTPTLSRPIQAYCLNRLAQTLKLVRPPLLWIVVEMTSQSAEVADILRRTGVMYRHLVCNKNVTELKDPYAHQRNAALSHIETHRLNGIVYFADDDNVYSLDLFEQMRRISRFGTWKVAKMSFNGVLLGGPVCNATEVIGWNTNEIGRRFHAEISGFAFNSTILWDPKRWHRPVLDPIRQLDTVKEKLLVSAFIEQLVEDETQMEGQPKNCSSILVWQLPPIPLESSSSFTHKKLMGTE